MKKLLCILAVGIMITGCHTRTLDEELATALILEKNHYPNIVDHYIFCNDPVHAYTISKSGLIEQGYVKVLQSKKFGDTIPFVSFTAADEEFGAIAAIRIMSSGTKAIVTYNSIRRKNVFAKAVKNGVKDTLNHELYFIQTDDGWRIMDKKSEIEFLAF